MRKMNNKSKIQKIKIKLIKKTAKIKKNQKKNLNQSWMRIITTTRTKSTQKEMAQVVDQTGQMQTIKIQ